jgi:high-affinity iron transporter
VPTWMGAWFEMYSTWETLAAQILALALVIGSYFAAEQVRIKRPQRRAAALS